MVTVALAKPCSLGPSEWIERLRSATTGVRVGHEARPTSQGPDGVEVARNRILFCTVRSRLERTKRPSYGSLKPRSSPLSEVLAVGSGKAHKEPIVQGHTGDEVCSDQSERGQPEGTITVLTYTPL